MNSILDFFLPTELGDIIAKQVHQEYIKNIANKIKQISIDGQLSNSGILMYEEIDTPDGGVAYEDFNYYVDRFGSNSAPDDADSDDDYEREFETYFIKSFPQQFFREFRGER